MFMRIEYTWNSVQHVTSPFLVTIHYLCSPLHNIHIHTDCFTVSNVSTNIHPVVNTKFCHRNPNSAAWLPVLPCQDDCWNEKGFERKRLCPTILRSAEPPTCRSVLTSRQFSFRTVGISTEIRIR